MTKSRHSATRLRLSRLFRWLGVLCFIKLTVLGMLAFDFPLPQWLTDGMGQLQSALKSDDAEQKAGLRQPVDTADIQTRLAAEEKNLAETTVAEKAAVQAPPASPALADADPAAMPQGSAAAQLAASIKPGMRQKGDTGNLIPRPGEKFVQSASSAPSLPAVQKPVDTTAPGMAPSMSQMPEPSQKQAPKLAAPPKQTEATTQAQVRNAEPTKGLLTATPETRAHEETGLLDLLGLTRLPIPGLGSVQAAHAAALDMPIPNTAPSSSPFTPAEQLAPLRTPTGMPEQPSPTIPQGAPAPAGNAQGMLPPMPAAQNTDNFDLPAPMLNASPAQPANRGGQAAAQPMPAGRSNRDMPGLAPLNPNNAPQPTPTRGISPDDPNNKAQELARQQQDILMLRQQMDQRLKDLENAEKKVKDMLREAKGLEDSKIKSLIQMYANMKARQAAKALESMDERVAVRILSGMAPKQSGEILTYTNPGKTAKFTELITRMRLPE